MKARWTTLALALSCAWFAWQATTRPHADHAVGAAGKSPARVAVKATPPVVAKQPVSPSELESLRAQALTHADAARARAARMGLDAMALSTELAREDPRAAIRLANQIGEEAPRRQALAHALAQLAASDPRAAWDILQDTSDPSERAAIAGPVLAAVADHDPLAVAEWIAREDTPQALANSLAVPVVQRWTQQDPEAAAAWVAAYPGGPLRELAAEALMQVWASADAPAAAAWVDCAPTALRDEMAAALGSALIGSDPGTARSLLASIESETWHSRLLSRLEFQTSPPPPPLPEDHEHAAGTGAACGCMAE